MSPFNAFCAGFCAAGAVFAAFWGDATGIVLGALFVIVNFCIGRR